MKRSFIQRLARILVVHAVAVLQKKRSDWARAMRNEFEYVPEGFTALSWSVGCLYVSYTERVRIMEIGSLKTTRVSRVVLTLEMLLCFMMPTASLIGLFFLTAIQGNPEYWSTNVSSLFSILLFTTSFVGPLGLYLAFRSVVLRHRRIGKGLGFVFPALAAWTLVGNSFFVLSVSAPGYELRGIFRMAILPSIGAAHLIWMSKADRSDPAPAS